MASKYYLKGQHTFGELTHCDPFYLKELGYLELTLKKACEAAGATVLGVKGYKFDGEDAGCTVIAILSESHASLHTYPEHRALFFDLFTCGDSCEAGPFLQELEERLDGWRHQVQTISRGQSSESK
jgi:S-adenosylmethionine decarboxylase proenzyme